jgi:hypothetical protein
MMFGTFLLVESMPQQPSRLARSHSVGIGRMVGFDFEKNKAKQ